MNFVIFISQCLFDCPHDQFIKQIDCLTKEIKNIDKQIDNLLNQQTCICM